MKLKSSRYPSRTFEDKELIYSVLDEGLFCTIAFNREGIPHQIPTGFCRIEDHIYIHASSKSHFITSIVGQQVSFSVTHLDALVLAPTAFDHSFNYRSVIGFSEAKEITDEKEKLEIFNIFTDRYIPGRIGDVGEPTTEQVGITQVIQLSLDRAAVKMREGDTRIKDLKGFDKWVGVIPFEHSYGTPEVDQKMADRVELPSYLQKMVLKTN